jgi:hypothetical protein
MSLYRTTFGAGMKPQPASCSSWTMLSKSRLERASRSRDATVMLSLE